MDAGQINQPFIYRAVVLNDAYLLSGSEPRMEGALFLGIPEPGMPGRLGVVVLPFAGGTSLSGLLEVVKTRFVQRGLGFPCLIAPSPAAPVSAAQQEVEEYCLVYDFVQMRRGAAVSARQAKEGLPDASAVLALEPASVPRETQSELSRRLAESSGFPASWWEGALVRPVEGLRFAVAAAGEEAAGLMAVLDRQPECRLVALHVLPEHRGQGLGSSLVAHHLGLARSSEVPLITAAYCVESACQYYFGRFGLTPVLEWVFYLPPEPGFFAPG